MWTRSGLTGLALFAALGADICQAQSANSLRDGANAYARGDFATALQIFRSLAEQGNVTAQFDLAVMHANGHGVPQNFAEAMKWYGLAAGQGNSDSLSSLGSFYQNGTGVAVDYVKAYVLFDLAASMTKGDAGQTARANRDSLASKMATAQLGQAQAQMRQCQTENVKACSGRLLANAAVFSPGNQALNAPMMVKLESDHGIYVVPVLVNGTLNLKFGVDSGASIVCIPADVMASLVNSGTIANSDFLGQTTMVLADGSKIPSQVFRIRSLKVGDLVMENVIASVTPAKGALLLGQSFLSRLKSWSLDNASHTLILN